MTSQRRNWLLRYLDVQDKYDSLIATALLDASEDAEKGIRQRLGDERIGNRTRRYQLGLASRAAKDSIRVLFAGLYRTIAAGQSDAAVAALEAGFSDDARIMHALIPEANKRANFQDSLRQSASRGVNAMMTRILVSRIPLSEQVYKTRALSNGSVDRIINSALAKGDSAADIAKTVKDSINPNTPGGVAYAAKRLGRTEINNAFHAQTVADAQDKPWVNNIEWKLSLSHPYSPAWLAGSRDHGIELCERYSLGTYTPENITIKCVKHPNCLCTAIPKAIDWTEFQMNLLAGTYDSYLDKQ
jgi:hypothetical protein